MAATPAPIAPPADAQTPVSFRHGTPSQFERLREFLVSSGFTYGELRRRQQVGHDAEKAGRALPEEDTDVVRVLAELFNAGLSLPWDAVRRAIPADALALLAELGLLADSDEFAGAASATVMINPIAGLYLLSDHLRLAPEKTAQPDLVFSPLTSNSQQFVALMPGDECDALLELCSGSGIAAFHAARSTRQVWAVDITDRSTRFAEFSAALNGITNVTVLRGDLYDPVHGLTFDRVVVHPPYMPAFEQELIFRDGGADGEQITRRIVAGLPDVLRPGGRLYCVCLATDREGEPLESRVRAWLGERADDFDVLFVDLQDPAIPAGYFARRAYETNSGFADLEARNQFFQEERITALVFGVLVVQRRPDTRATFTTRRLGGPDTLSAQIEWALRWETEATDPALPRRMVEARPKVSDHVAVRMTHRRRGGAFTPTDFEILTETPFRVSLPCKAWLPTFLSRCDGTVSVRDQLVPLQAKGIMEPNVTAEEFARFVMDQISLGILDVPGHEIPARSTAARELSGSQSE